MIKFQAVAVLAVFIITGNCCNAVESPVPKEEASRGAQRPAFFDPKKVDAEIEAHYAKAHPEIQEYVRWTAQTFGKGGLWLPEDAFSNSSDEAREKKIQHLATLFSEAEYGRHLCAGLAEASALKDKRFVPGLIQVAGYHLADRDYDCRAKWMAVAALARQESEEAVPLLISLVDHGNQNTRNWSRAALARQTGQDFIKDKQAWAKWWREEGHKPIPESFLKPYQAPPPDKK